MDSFIMSRLKSEKDEITLKFDKAIMENNILTKQLDQLNKDHGELLLNNKEAQFQLTESVNECEDLRKKLGLANQEFERVKDEYEEKIRDFTSEIKILKKQNVHLSEENESLEEKLRDCKLQIEGFKRKIMRLEEEIEEIGKREKKVLEKLKKAEDDRVENSRLSMKNSKLERDLGGVVAAASDRFRRFEKRVSELERVVANLNADYSGSQLVENTHLMQEQESCGPEAKHQGLVGAPSVHETTAMEEKTASSMPSPKALNATPLKGRLESFESDARPADEKSASSMPSAHKSPSEVPCFVDLCSSDDDDGEQPSRKGLKRKLPYDESGNSNRNWDYEADILEDLRKDTELCMEGICALYRQHMLYGLR
ncbi:uncharacterized protein LOC104892191 isoform X2 [Beta vulgaris subsp. vulgaris]|nr:uncharacterized protein LOC104892191 isoform X2 [Beta vulgaris subsp. vulgaris]